MTTPLTEHDPDHGRCSRERRLSQIAWTFWAISALTLGVHILTRETGLLPEWINKSLIWQVCAALVLMIIVRYLRFRHGRRCDTCQAIEDSGITTSPKKYDSMMRLGNIGHHMRWALIVSLVAEGVLTAAPDNVAVKATENILSLLTIIIGVVLTVHILAGCTRCNEIILNGSEIAEKRTTTIRVWHAVIDQPVKTFWRYLIGLVTVIAALYLLHRFFGEWPSYALGSLMVFFIIGVDVVFRRHSQIMIWCPRCHHGGDDGDDETVVDPVPQPAATA